MVCYTDGDHLNKTEGNHLHMNTGNQQCPLRGNAVVGQSGGPTAAINATLAGVIRGVMAERERGGMIRTLYGMRNGIDGFLRGQLSDLDSLFDPACGGSAEAWETLTLTPAAALGSCRRRLPTPGSQEETEVMSRLLDVCKAHDIRYFFYIGGNDSMDTAAKLSAYTASCGYSMRVIGIPKTIDNDLEGTDHTPGFGSAAKYVAVTVQEILLDTAVYIMPAVTVVEIMGRDAGWLTAASALGLAVGVGGPDLVYLPERSFDFDAFYEDVAEALTHHPHVVVAVSEGLRCADGSYVGERIQSGLVDAFGHRYLAGTGKALEQAIRERFGCKVRSVELNLPQRCAAHLLSAQDIEESLAVGTSAVNAAVGGASGVMMSIYRTSDTPYAYTIGYKELSAVANQTRRVPDDFINTRGNQVTDACLAYLFPLIRGERYPAYEGGLPKYFVIP